MKKVKHWLHIILCILTSGLWLPIYVILLATTEMFNRGYREGKAAGRVEKSNEYEEERQRPKTVWAQAPDVRTVNCRSVAVPILDDSKPLTRVDRFAELADRNRTVGLDAEERREYFDLRAELSK
jgi:hypothetical protein